MDNYDKLTEIRLNSLMSEEDEQLLADAYASYQYKKIDALWEKYKDKEVIQEEDVVEEIVSKDTYDDSYKLYNAFRRTLRYSLFKETILDSHDHTCFLCKMKFPKKEDFKKSHPKTTYPMFVRCAFSIPTMIKKRGFETIDDCMNSRDLFNSNFYLPICDTCKPASFTRKNK